MEIILDTNFMLICLKENIDFLEAGEFGKLLVPKLVMDELEKLSKRGKAKNREIAVIALGILGANKDKFELIELEKKFVDAGIKKYVENRKDLAVATLDKELKKALKGKVKFVVIRARKNLELI